MARMHNGYARRTPAQRRSDAPSRRPRLAALAAAALVAAATGCRPAAPAADAAAGRAVRATATVGMITDAVRIVGGDRVAVTGLMGPGVDPHLYKPTAGDVIALGEADIVFYGGLHLEGRMVELFEHIAAGGRPTVAVTADIPPQRLRHPADFAGAADPHVWFDVRLWQSAVRTIAAALVAIDPAGQAVYDANRDAYLAELDALDAWIVAETAAIPPPQRVLVTAHDAFGYFGDRYGFDVRGIQGVSTAAEAGAADIRRLADLIAERRLKAIFVESSVPPATIEALEAAVASRGWRVAIGPPLFSDALGSPDTPAASYVGMVRHNVGAIVGALR